MDTELPEASSDAASGVDVGRRHQATELLDVTIPESVQATFTAAPKSPTTVQQWVDSIEVSSCHHTRSHGQTERRGGLEVIPLWPSLIGTVEREPVTAAVAAAEEEPDQLGLGAEAVHLREEQAVQDGRLTNKRQRLQSSREQQQSFVSELSGTSTTASSVSAFLEAMRDDPEEILANLGFAGSESTGPLARIPRRFLLCPSKVKGNDLAGFLERYEEMQEINDTVLSGYMGLSGYRMDGQIPSGIVSKILEKIGERNRDLKRARLSLTSSASTASAVTVKPSFFQAAYSVMAVNAFRNAIRPATDDDSILEPKNRKSFEDRTTTARNKKRTRRLVLGRHSLTVNSDEELVDDADPRRHRPSRAGLPSPGDRKLSDNVFAPVDSNPDSPMELPSSLPSNGTTTTTLERDDGLTDDALANVSSKRSTFKMTRQFSLHEETSADFEHQSKPQAQMSCLEAVVKSGFTKESFELEELPASVASDVQDDDWNVDSTGCKWKERAESGGGERTSSAMSDSSGFLEYETVEVARDVIEEISASEALETKTEPVSEEQSKFETDNDEGLLAMTESDTPVAATVVESDTLSSGNDDDEDESSAVGNASSRSPTTQQPDFGSNLTRSRSEATLDFGRSRVQRQSSTNTESGSIGGDGRVAALTRFWSTVGGDGDGGQSRQQTFRQKVRPSGWMHNNPASPNTTSHTRPGCSAEMAARMQDVVTRYTSELLAMEESSRDTHDRLSPRLTASERDELKMLGELRRCILEEADRTSSLLRARMTSKGVDEETRPSQAAAVGLPSPSTFEQMKQEILQEVKDLVRADQQTFLRDIQATRRAIDEVKELVARLMNVVQTMKLPD